MRLCGIAVLVFSVVCIALICSTHALAATYTVTNTDDSGDGSLRWAIEQANTNPGPDDIVFDPLLLGGVIGLATRLPDVTDDRTTIDGEIDGLPGPDITIDGTYAPGASANGITLLSANNEVRGLLVTHFNAVGILAFGPLAEDNVIVENTAIDNGGSGAATSQSASAWIEDNVFINNNGFGNVGVYDYSTATVLGNVITGGNHGVALGTGSTATIESNTIDHAGIDGVRVRKATATIRANKISQSTRYGVNVNDGDRVSGGTKATIVDNEITGSGENGVFVREWDMDPPERVEASIVDNIITDSVGEGVMVARAAVVIAGNTISRSGATGISVLAEAIATIEGNTISAISGQGMWISNSFGVTVAGNTVFECDSNGIGLGKAATATITGNLATGNGGNGIALHDGSEADVEGNTVIGSGAHGIAFWGENAGTISQNYVSGSGWSGIYVRSSTATVTHNDVSGSVEHGMYWRRNAVGSVLGDTIYGNGGDGVAVEGSTNVTVSQCSIYDNGGLGINLVGGIEDVYGVTENDYPDADTGPNGLLNFPVFGSFHIAGSVATFEGAAPPDSTVEVFTAAADPSGYGEGATYLTSAIANPLGSFTVDVSAWDLPITATATTDEGTSEFSALPVSGIIPVEIDIKPGSDINAINNNGNGVIPVAVLGSEDFDVRLILPGTAQLESMGVKAVGKANKLLSHYEDVNGDGFEDLVLQIQDVDGAFAEGATVATLTAATIIPGAYIVGEDDIIIVPGS